MTQKVVHFLSSTLSAIENVTKQGVVRNDTSQVKAAMTQLEIGVLVGIVGELPGRLFIEGPLSTFAKLGQSMYGVDLTGEMLESFVGEFGNMVAGHTAASLSGEGMRVNISPPTVIVGHSKLSGFSEGILVTLELAVVGEMRVTLILEDS